MAALPSIRRGRAAKVLRSDVNPLKPQRPRICHKWAYPVGDVGIYLSLADAVIQTGDTGTAEIQVHCDGPNLGSAGGPTLQPLGAIARLHYQGLLIEGFR